MSKEDVLAYEISSAWWPQFVHPKWAQELAARHFALKAGRKYARIQKTKELYAHADRINSASV